MIFAAVITFNYWFLNMCWIMNVGMKMQIKQIQFIIFLSLFLATKFRIWPLIWGGGKGSLSISHWCSLCFLSNTRENWGEIINRVGLGRYSLFFRGNLHIEIIYDWMLLLCDSRSLDAESLLFLVSEEKK